ncbi:Extracellular matrix binding protein [Staphylococcus aureus]|nr:Extracellular matrix binding protein [Staphylococcus aureus]
MMHNSNRRDQCNPDATQEERQAAIEKVNAAVAVANTNILNANTQC